MSDAEVVHQVTCHRVAFGHLHPECVGILGRGKHLSPGAVRSKQGGQLVRDYFKFPQARTTALNQVQTSWVTQISTSSYALFRRDYQKRREMLLLRSHVLRRPTGGRACRPSL